MSLFSNILREFQSCMFYTKSNLAKIAFYSLFVIPSILFIINLWYIMDAMDKNYIFQNPRFFEDIYFFANNYYEIYENVFVNEYIFLTSICWLMWYLSYFLVQNTFKDSINLQNKNINILMVFLQVSFFIILIIYCIFIYLDNTEEYNIGKTKKEFDQYINQHVIHHDFISKLEEKGEIYEVIRDIDQTKITQYLNEIYTDTTYTDHDEAKIIATCLIFNQMANNKYIINQISRIKWFDTVNASTGTLFEISFLPTISTKPEIISLCNDFKNNIDSKILKIKQMKSISFSKQFIAIICQSIFFILLILTLFYNKKEK